MILNRYFSGIFFVFFLFFITCLGFCDNPSQPFIQLSGLLGENFNLATIGLFDSYPVYFSIKNPKLTLNDKLADIPNSCFSEEGCDVKKLVFVTDRNTNIKKNIFPNVGDKNISLITSFEGIIYFSSNDVVKEPNIYLVAGVENKIVHKDVSKELPKYLISTQPSISKSIDLMVYSGLLKLCGDNAESAYVENPEKTIEIIKDLGKYNFSFNFYAECSACNSANLYGVSYINNKYNFYENDIYQNYENDESVENILKELLKQAIMPYSGITFFEDLSDAYGLQEYDFALPKIVCEYSVPTKDSIKIKLK